MRKRMNRSLVLRRVFGIGLAALLSVWAGVMIIGQLPIAYAVTIQEQVGAGGDNGHSRGTGLITNPALDAPQIGLWFGQSASNAFFRFTTVNIPNGATINSATLQIKPLNAADDGAGIRTNISFSDEDNAAALVSEADHDGRKRTDTNVTWDNFNLVNNVWANSTDISAPLQEVVDRPGWVANNNLLLLWDDDGSNNGRRLITWNYASSANNATILNADYTAWVNTAPSISNKITADTVNQDVAYSRLFTATDPDTNQTTVWELEETNATFAVTVTCCQNRSAWVNTTPPVEGQFYINVTVGDQGTTGNLTDFVNFTLHVIAPATTLTDAESFILWLYVILILALLVLGWAFRFPIVWILESIVVLFFILYMWPILIDTSLVMIFTGFGLLIGAVGLFKTYEEVFA